MTVISPGVTRLTRLGVMAVEGEDAADFLQGQLTNDIALLPVGQARLAAYCTAKGRVLASFVAIKVSAQQVLLVCSSDILPATLKRLSMFVLRAKARLTDVSAQWDLYGVVGAGNAQGAEPWTARIDPTGMRVALYPALGQPRALVVAAAGSAAPAGDALDENLWALSEVRSGVATVTQPIVEALVPQMLNYESVGGVSFKKGCYPGQEVVARSQFRGTLKRRAYIAHCPRELAAGQELFHESDPGQPCGVVAQAARNPEGGWDAIASMQVSAAGGGRVTAGSADGPEVQVQPPPYPLLADV
jgi:folate-binding protein YgfZ